MKRVIAALACLAMVLVFVSCGEGPAGPADPELAAPGSYLYLFALKSPALVIDRIDAVLADAGIPGVTEATVSNLIASASPYGDLSATLGNFGVNPDGSVLVFMTAMAPNSFGGAVSLADAEALWGGLEAVGLVLEEAESVGGVDAKSIASPMGPIYIAVHRDLALFAGTRSILEGMIERVDSGTGGLELPAGDALMYSSTDLSAIGPMISAQLGQYSSLSMSTMDYDPTGMNRRMMEGMFDLASLFLTETGMVDWSIAFGPDLIECSSSVEFLAGSSLDAFFLPWEGDDLAALIPAGESVVGRVRLAPETTEQMLMVFSDLLGFDLSQDMLDAFVLMSRNTAISMYSGTEEADFFQVLAVYEVGDGLALADLKAMMLDYLDIVGDMLDSATWITFEEPTEVDFNGRTYVYYLTSVDMQSYMESLAIPDPGAAAEIDMAAIPSMEFPVWMTVEDGLLWLEMAAEPTRIDASLSAGFPEGGSAADMEIMSFAMPEEEISIAVNLPAYMASMMSFSAPIAGLDLSSLEGTGDDSWLYYGIDFYDGGMAGRCIMSNDGLSAAIGAFAEFFMGIQDQVTM
jgi:hypothetical protein